MTMPEPMFNKRKKGGIQPSVSGFMPGVNVPVINRISVGNEKDMELSANIYLAKSDQGDLLSEEKKFIQKSPGFIIGAQMPVKPLS